MIMELIKQRKRRQPFLAVPRYFVMRGLHSLYHLKIQTSAASPRLSCRFLLWRRKLRQLLR